MLLTPQTTRDLKIDIIKGLGIILMVLGHSKFIYTRFIYLFHMALFFMASGYLFKDKYSQSIQSIFSFIKRKIKSLWIPFFVSNTIFIILHNFFIKLNIYSNQIIEIPNGTILSAVPNYTTKDILIQILKGLHMGNSTSLGSALWFLKTLLLISVLYALIQYLINKSILLKKYHTIVQFIISLIFLMIGYYCSIHNYMFKGFNKAFSYYILFYIGQILYLKRDIATSIPKNLLIPVTFILLLVLNNVGQIELVENSYTNPLFLLTASLLGWLLISSIAYYIKYSAIISNVLSIISEQSLYILILHLLSFKLVTLVQVLIYNEPYEYISSFPVLHSDGLWCIAYTIMGITLPILFHNSISKIILFIKTKLCRQKKYTQTV